MQINVNGKHIETNDIPYAQSNLDFFNTFSSGKSFVNFQVGEQKIRNEIRFRKNEFEVYNNFVPFDMDSFAEQQKIRVRAEQTKANFSDELTDVYYLSASTLLSYEHQLPVFNLDRLEKDPGGPKFFVSHRWQSTWHPDPDGRHLSMLKEHARSHPGAFYWIDFSCLPQPRNSSDDSLFMATLPKIACIQSNASTIVIREDGYEERLWCYIEHYTGVLFSQTNFEGSSSHSRTIEYIGERPKDNSIVDRVQTLQEPAWAQLKVTNAKDIPGIKYNYTWLANLVRFQLYDRYSELRRSLPGEIYSGSHYFQSAFGIDYPTSLAKLRKLFFEFNGDIQNFYKADSLLWLAKRFSQSAYPDRYKVESLLFSPYLFFSEEAVGWIALLLGIINKANHGTDSIKKLREMYSTIILMSLYS